MRTQGKTVANLEFARYCKACGYALRALTTPRCPECGRDFDPANSRTTRHKPGVYWLHKLKWAAVVVLVATVSLAATWGWLYRGWHREQDSLADLSRGFGLGAVRVEPLGSRWMQTKLGSHGYLLDRVRELEIERWPTGANPSSLAAFTSLTELNLNDVPVTVMPSLAGMSDLTGLVFLPSSDEGTLDVSPLSGLTALKGLRLLHVKELSPLKRLTNLESLDLNSNPVRDLQPLAGLTQLRTLQLDNTPTSDIEPLRALAKLETLSMSTSNVRDIGPLSGLTEVVAIDMPFNPITTISSPLNLKKLRRLNVSESDLSSISALAGCTRLHDLNLADTHVADVQAASSMAELLSLDLSGTRVKDLSPLRMSTWMTTLSLQKTPVSDLTPLAGLKHLETLNLFGTKVHDLTPLAGLGTLRLVCLPDGMTPEQIRRWEQILPACRFLKPPSSR